jgi:hypothetical protein
MQISAFQLEKGDKKRYILYLLEKSRKFVPYFALVEFKIIKNHKHYAK